MNYESLFTKHNHFTNYLMKQFGVASLSNAEIAKLNEPLRTWFNWGLEGFSRAEQTFHLLQRFINCNRNMRHLDIGCGPGYLSTIFAINYFESIGVDIIDLSHAMSNKMDFPYLNLNFFNIDCMKDDILHLGQFDIITIDNVIEHVDSPLILVNKVRQVLNHHGIIYLIIPNPHFVDTVKKDPHYQLFGISLLDKKDGDIMVKSLTNLNCYDVNNYFCKYDISNYEAIFSRFGFKWIPFNDIILSTPELQQQCFLQLNCEAVNTYFSNELIKLENRLPNEIFDKLSYVTGIYLRELGAEYEFTKENLNQFTLNHFYLKYLQGSWFFILSLSKA